MGCREGNCAVCSFLHSSMPTLIGRPSRVPSVPQGEPQSCWGGGNPRAPHPASGQAGLADSRTFLSGWQATGPGSGRLRNRNTQPACGSFCPARKESRGMRDEGRKTGVHRRGCRRKPGKVGPGARQGPKVCTFTTSSAPQPPREAGTEGNSGSEQVSE